MVGDNEYMSPSCARAGNTGLLLGSNWICLRHNLFATDSCGQAACTTRRRHVNSWLGATPCRRATRLEGLFDHPNLLGRRPAPTALTDVMISTRSVGLLIDTVVCLTLAKWETYLRSHNQFHRKNALYNTAATSLLTSLFGWPSKLLTTNFVGSLSANRSVRFRQGIPFFFK